MTGQQLFFWNHVIPFLMELAIIAIIIIVIFIVLCIQVTKTPEYKKRVEEKRRRKTNEV